MFFSKKTWAAIYTKLVEVSNSQWNRIYRGFEYTVGVKLNELSKPVEMWTDSPQAYFIVFHAYGSYFNTFLGAYLEQKYLAYGFFTYCILIDLIHTFLCFLALIFVYFDQISKTEVR